MFTGVCLSTGGVSGPRGVWSRGVPGPGGGACSGGFACPGGFLVDTPLPPGRPLLRTVRILLECILVNSLI